MSMPTLGTDNQTVSFASRMNLSGFNSTGAGGQQTHAPFSQATNMSNTDRSTVWSNICEKRSVSEMPYLAAIALTKCLMFRWVTPTPLGIPVLPDVNRR